MAKINPAGPAPVAAAPLAAPYPAPAPQAPTQQAAPPPPPAPVWNGEAWVLPAPEAAPAPPPPAQTFQAPPPPQGAFPGFAQAPSVPAPTNGSGYAPQPPPPVPAPTGIMGQMSTLMNQGAVGGATSLLKSLRLGNIDDSSRGGQLLALKDPITGAAIQYEGKVVKSDPAKSKEGNDMIAIEVIVTFPQAGAGCKLYDNLTYGETSVWKLKSMMRATGTLSEDGELFTGNSEKDFLDNIVRFGIRHDEWPEGSGQFKNKIATGYSEGYETPGLAGVAPTATIQPAQAPLPAPTPSVPGQPNFGPA